MIDRVTGEVILSEPAVVLGPNLTEEQFLAAAGGDVAVRTGAWDEWSQYSLTNAIIGGERFAMTILFEHSRVRQLSFAIRDESTSWRDYSRADEKYKKSRHDVWLRKSLGTWRRRFGWGTVAADVDSKTGDAGIVVQYARRVR